MFNKAGQVGHDKVDGNRNESDDGTNLPGIPFVIKAFNCDWRFVLKSGL